MTHGQSPAKDVGDMAAPYSNTTESVSGGSAYPNSAADTVLGEKGGTQGDIVEEATNVASKEPAFGQTVVVKLQI